MFPLEMPGPALRVATTFAAIDRSSPSGAPAVITVSNGRAADALISRLRHAPPADPELVDLAHAAARKQLTRRPELFRIVAIEAGRDGLCDALIGALASQ